MKHQLFFMLLCLFLLGSSGFTQSFSLPDVTLRDKNNRQISATTLVSKGEVLILLFWDVDEEKSCHFLDDLAVIYTDSLVGQKVKFVAVAVPKSGNAVLARNYVAVNAPEIDFMIDENGVLARQLGVHELPWTMLFDVNQKLVCQYRGYCIGADAQLCSEARNCLKKL
ncbi:MAG: redoxin domain-containing protein [Bacteroidales bacterium]|nr:redoxin domain-containing protein [Bacteroidales bacterium]